MPQNPTITDHMLDHLNQSMARALAAERFPSWKRACPELEDIDFIRLGILRCISTVDSGRHFLQSTEEIQGEHLPLSTYFKSLKSVRRANMLEVLERQSYQLHCDALSSQGVDYLKSFPELDDYIVEAADGHFIDHACHTPKGTNGKVYAAGFIYALNFRNGLLRPLCPVTNGTRRHQEIPVLRDYLEQHNPQKTSEKHLWVYDKAVTDYPWWNTQKQHGHYMISMLKENAVAIRVQDIPFDVEDEINTGVEGYGLYENNGIRFSVVDYRDPETNRLHHFAGID